MKERRRQGAGADADDHVEAELGMKIFFGIYLLCHQFQLLEASETRRAKQRGNHHTLLWYKVIVAVAVKENIFLWLKWLEGWLFS